MIKINIASSTNCLPDFINFDNSIFLHIVKICPFAIRIFPEKYQKILADFREANSKYDLRIWNCKKILPFKDSSIDHALCSHYLEHLHKADGLQFLKNLYLKIKPGGSLHLILPDLRAIVNKYLAESNNLETAQNASDSINFETILTHEKSPTFIYNLLEALGWFGLQHRYMFDKSSALKILIDAGFIIKEMPLDCPSYDFYRNDRSIHIYCIKN